MNSKTLYHGVLRVVFILALSIAKGKSIDITVTDGGYGNVVVAIGDDLDEKNCESYVTNLKDMMNSASPVLYSATADKLYFSSVTILIPENWTSCGTLEIASNENQLTFEDSHIRVRRPHPFFANNPWTQQPRGCGDPGEYIYFSSDFLSLDSPKWGSRGAVFVHEWAKFRWGVFEEYGHGGDSIFPSAYRFNETVWQPNYCTDGDVNGNLGSCTEDTLEKDCIFTPDAEQIENVTSSLLAAPFIGSVNTFCTSENHVKSAPTKQNLLCNKQSTWEVISKHPDISETTSGKFQPNITFSVQQTEGPLPSERFVFLLDVTSKMGPQPFSDGGYFKWDYVLNAVRQFIYTKASDGSQVAIISFDILPIILHELVVLNETNRAEVAKSVPETISSTESYKNVASAIDAAAKVLGDRGKIILITETQQEQIGDKRALVENANGLPVQPILYPHNPGVSTALYQPVAEINNLNPEIVNNSLFYTYQAIECLVNLTQLIQEAGESEYVMVASGKYDESSSIKKIDLLVEDASIYESEFFIELLTFDYGGEKSFHVQGPSSAELVTQDLAYSYIFNGKTLKEGTYNVSTDIFIRQPFYASLYALPKASDNSQPLYSIDVSSSTPLSDLSFTKTPPMAPILYATLSDGINPIVHAEVTATIHVQGSEGSQDIYSFDLKLWDIGVGGDITGNDGTYSSYLIGVEDAGILTVSVTASDNNGTAMVVRRASLNSLSAAPIDPTDITRACCGSSLQIPDDLLTSAGTFTVSSRPGIHGKATGTFPGPNMYPPGRVTDLMGTREEDELNLVFTATGEDFNIGRATSYNVKDQLSSSIWPVNTTEDFGTSISTSVTVVCDTKYSFVVEAIDSQDIPSEFSNEVHIVYSCVEEPPTLSTGAIVGIVLGCIFFVILIIIIVCAICKRDKVKDSKVGSIFKCQSCKCCKKKVDNADDKKRSHLVTSRIRSDDVPSRNPTPRIDERGYIHSSAPRAPVRSVGDVLRRHDHLQMTGNTSDGSGSYGEQRNTRMSDLRDDSSLASSVSSSYNPMFNPRNQVGIPPQGPRQFNPSLGDYDNPAYNDTESATFGASRPVGVTKKPVLPPIQRRNLTQV